jgi:hypothetical protein
MNTVDANWHIVIVATFTSLVNNIRLATLRMCEVDTTLELPFTAALHALGALLCSGHNGNNMATGRNSLGSLMKNRHVVASSV